MLHAVRRNHSHIFTEIPRIVRFSFKESEKRRSIKLKQQFSNGDDFLLLLSVMTMSGPHLQMKAICTTGGTKWPSVSLLQEVVGEQKPGALAGAEVSINAELRCWVSHHVVLKGVSLEIWLHCRERCRAWKSWLQCPGPELGRHESQGLLSDQKTGRASWPRDRNFVPEYLDKRMCGWVSL